jgi:phasin family protein
LFCAAQQALDPGSAVIDLRIQYNLQELTMFATPAQFQEMNKTSLDALMALSHTMFDATERLVDLNLAATKATLEETAQSASALLAVRDVQELTALGNTLAQPSLEKFVSYGRSVYGIASGAGAEFARIADAQVSEGNRKVAELVEFAAKNAPQGSEPAVSALKSAAQALNTAYDTYAKAAMQVADAVESNIAAASAATLKATAVAGEAVKGKGKKSN